MLRNLLVVIFLGSCVCLAAQTGGNPFDLKFRKSKPIPSSSPAKSSPDTGLISKTELPLPSSVPAVDNTAIEDTTIRNLGKTQTDTVRKSDSSNPFELSHAADSVQATGQGVAADEPKAKEPTSLMPPVLMKNASKGFQIFFLLLSLLFLIFIVNVERNFVRDLWRVISNENYSSLHHRNQRNTMRQILLLMGYSVFIFQAGIFIYHALRILHYQGPVSINLWIPMSVVLAVYVVRHLSIRYLRWLFNNEKEMTLFGFDISIFNTMVGLVLLPVNILLLFGPESMYKPLIIIGIIAFIAAYASRQLRWILTARGLIAQSLFLFFVYLCAIEILPLWALSKFFW